MKINILNADTFPMQSTWEGLVSAIPYGIKYGIISMVFCLCSILLNELVLKKFGGSIRMSINKYLLSFIFGTSVTWLAGTMLAASVTTCYCLAGAIGLTIEWFAPLFKKEVFDRLKKALNL